MSTSSFFETISKDEESERISDFDNENYKELENSFQVMDSLKEQTRIFETSDKNKECENILEKEIEVKKIPDSSDFVPLAEEELSSSAMPVPLDADKKTLSISVADIVESTELSIACDQTTEPLLLEQFADVESLSQQVALIENFNSFETDMAVPRIHKSADTSLGVEKTEGSDNWLEAETEYSISEFEDEAVSLSEKENLTGCKKIY
ncbi:RBR-type E3 ubiquitin transferase [Caerostris extrusa]|uniref:RBR-type E3 ubiquitin transferase n=1 Tax=Caerostris extrusa TaxID=172846 RepID=A0AAV4UPJ6_CAEEX|nr:RBR-type E3 ubiquitin transferase [Caerostris extrusa]